MASATAHPNHQLISSEDVEGTNVYDMKGTKIGDIEVSHKHAAFFVNRGHGTAEQVKQLITQVQSTVKEKFGVELKAEVFYLA